MTYEAFLGAMITMEIQIYEWLSSLLSVLRRKEKIKLDCFSGLSVFLFISARLLPPTGENNFSPKTVDETGDGSET